MTDTNRDVGLVLAGGGARGAYEMGALSVLLPALKKQSQSPGVMVGTSVGALNTAFFASTAHIPLDQAIDTGLEMWKKISFSQVLRSLKSPAELRRIVSYAGQFMQIPGARLDSLLDPSPLHGTLREHVPVPEIERNVTRGHLHAVGVVATSAATSRSVVFHRGGKPRPRDNKRAIDYADTEIREEHVRASAAIPGVFPAVRVPSPERARGWYFDGGTRLNTPIKPALELGAKRVVVVALNAIEAQPARLAGEHRPDALEGAYQILDALLAAPLANDMATLAGINQEVGGPGAQAGGREQIPYIFVAPSSPYAIGELAREVFNDHYDELSRLLCCDDIAVLGRAVAGGSDSIHGELLSYLFFAPEFGARLVAMGQRDAHRWLSDHPRDLWETGPLDVART